MARNAAPHLARLAILRAYITYKVEASGAKTGIDGGGESLIMRIAAVSRGSSHEYFYPMIPEKLPGSFHVKGEVIHCIGVILDG